MSAPLIFEVNVDSQTVGVQIESPTIPVANQPEQKVVFAVIQGTPGATGAPGAPGPAFNGTAWWYGEGQPNLVIGAKTGDFYMDTLTGTVYELRVG